MYKEFSEKSLFFTYPFNSHFLNIHTISQTSDTLNCAKVSELVQKCAVLPHRDGFVAIPLFHTFYTFMRFGEKQQKIHQSVICPVLG